MHLHLRLHPSRPVLRRILGAIAVALLAALLGWASPAAAHDELVTSDPAEAGLVEVLPSRAVLTLSGPIEKVREVTVTGPDGSVVNGDPTHNGAEVRQNLWAGPDGAYVMTYEVVSADGHDVRGEVHFEVGSLSAPNGGETPGSATSDATDSGWWEGGGDVVVPAALLLLAGAAAVVLSRRNRAGRTT